MEGLSLDWRLVRLPNGLRLITLARRGTGVVAVRAYIRAGSRYDVEAMAVEGDVSRGDPA